MCYNGIHKADHPISKKGNILETKYCGKCKTILPLNKFYKNVRSRDGYATKCIDCQKKYLLDNKERVALKNKEYRYANIDNIKLKEKQYRENNKSKIAECKRNYNDKNHSKVVLQRAKYRSTEKGKAIQRNKGLRRRTALKIGSVTTKQIIELQQNAKVCYWCNNTLAHNNIHIDHYIPISKGGNHEKSNLVVSCNVCNQKKGSIDPIEFANSIGKLL